MATPKAPQDHLEKAGAVKDGMVGVELDGETYEVDPLFLDDLEMMEALEDGRIVYVLREMLGEAQWVTLKGNLKAASNDGKVRVAALEPVFTALVSSVGPTDSR